MICRYNVHQKKKSMSIKYITFTRSYIFNAKKNFSLGNSIYKIFSLKLLTKRLKQHFLVTPLMNFLNFVWFGLMKFYFIIYKLRSKTNFFCYQQAFKT